MKTKHFILILITAFSSIGHIWTLFSCPKAPYSHCNLGKPDHINVHVISHSHNDLGWVKTVLEYYNGSRYNLEPTVKAILDSVVHELRENPERRFIYAEMGFFWMWWNEQTEEKKSIVRMLVDQGRLEFIMGSWSMNDEATAYYSDIIDQQSLGFKFILEEFGPCARARVAWQIDPFGHSNEQASLFAQLGFDAVFLGRVDYQDSNARTRTKTREFVWQPSASLGDATAIFTSILPNVYWPPMERFCWESTCRYGDIAEHDHSQMLSEQIGAFYNVTMEQARAYRSNHLIMTFGNDFTHSNARPWFENLDRLINHFRRRPDAKVNLFHSTPACYIYAINQQRELKWNVNYDDFFPYADRPNCYWTGFFTSRPALKYNIRQSGNFLQMTRQLAVLSRLTLNYMHWTSIRTLERAMGIAQHHDAVTGTEKQYVADDYARQLWTGVEKCLYVINDSINMLLKRLSSTNRPIQTYYCPLANQSECAPIELVGNFDVIVYNPLSRRVRSWISLPVAGSNFQVVDREKEQVLVSDCAPVYKESQLIAERKSRANYRLIFEADLPPLGFKVFNVRRNAMATEIGPLPAMETDFILKNQNIGLRFDSKGNLIEVQNLAKGLTSDIKQSYCFYIAAAGSNGYSRDHSSGAYIFRPRMGSTPECLRVQQYSIAHLNRLTEVHQVFNEWISQTIRLYDAGQHVEFEWQIG